MDKQPEAKAAQEQEMRYLVRVANTDIKGERKLHHGLCSIKGVSFMFANMVCRLTKLDHNLKIGLLTDAQIALLEKVIADPVTQGSPVWMLNRRGDYETGEDKHILGGSLKFTKEITVSA